MSRALRAATAAAGLGLLLVVHLPAASAAMVTVVNADGAGEGFNDPTPVDPVGGNTATTLGDQRLIAFTFAANVWADLLNSAVEIRVHATFDALPCNGSSAVLGQAAPHSGVVNFAGAPFANTIYPIALANMLAGIDLDPGQDDIDAQFNSTFGTTCAFPGSFYLGLDSNPPGINDSDFVTVILHELCHGLGFTTLVDPSTGAKGFGFDDPFEMSLEDHSTGQLWPIMSNAGRAASAIDTGDLHWVGSNVVAAGAILTAGRDSGSGHVQMFAPDPVQPGSSVAHFDTVLTPDQVMEPFYTGAQHDPGLALQLLEDIDWSTNAGTQVGASITADNSYSWGFGPATGPTALAGNVANCFSNQQIISCSTIENPSEGPEHYTTTVNAADNFLYIVAWSDNGGTSGVLAKVTHGLDTFYSGTSAWQVYATGIDVACTGTPPTLTNVQAQVALANSNAGGPGSSVGWVGATVGANVGTLAIGQSNNVDGVVTNCGTSANVMPRVCSTGVNGIDPGAHWMWYNPTPASSDDPFCADGTGRGEYLIFRVDTTSAMPVPLLSPSGIGVLGLLLSIATLHVLRRRREGLRGGI